MQLDTHSECKTLEVVQQCKKKAYNTDFFFASSGISNICENSVMDQFYQQMQGSEAGVHFL